MTVVSKITTIDYTNGLGSGRKFVATATSTDIAAGTSTVVTITNTALGGAVDPGNPDTFTLRYVDDGGTVIETITLNTTSASQTDTFFFTTNGLTGGTARVGTIEIKLQVTKTTGGPTATYDTESDGAPNTPPTGFTAGTLNRGWIRSTTTRVQSFSNVSAGGAKSVAQYTESLFMRFTAAHTSYIARAISVVVSAGGLSGSTNSTTSPTRDIAFASVVDSRFAAAATVVTATATVPNASLTGLPAWIISTETTDTITVDPRLTCTHLLQNNQSAFLTPPYSGNQANGQRQATDLAYLATNVRAARGTLVGSTITQGASGVSLTAVLASNIDPTITSSLVNDTTTTRGGEAGWTSLFAWSNSLPGGNWTKTVSIGSGTTNLTNAYLVNPAITYTLIAKNPNYDARINLNHVAALAGRHFNPGMTITAVGYMVDFTTQQRLPGASYTSVKCSFVRAAPSDTSGLSNTFEFFNGTTWVTWSTGVAQTLFPMTASPIDPDTFEVQFTNTVNFGFRDFRVSVQFVLNGVTYTATLITINVDSSNQHDGYVVDAPGLALTGQLTFR